MEESPSLKHAAKVEQTLDREENDTGPSREQDTTELTVGITTLERKKTRRRLSEHFTIEEFDCKDGTHVPHGGYWRTLIYICKTYLEPMRAEFGSCTVHSGYRTKAWNDHVGGVPRSYHRYEIQARDDCASDVAFRTGDVAAWAKAADRIRQRERHGKGGLGVYPSLGFIHIDTRDFPADWRG